MKNLNVFIWNVDCTLWMIEFCKLSGAGPQKNRGNTDARFPLGHLWNADKKYNNIMLHISHLYLVFFKFMPQNICFLNREWPRGL